LKKTLSYEQRSLVDVESEGWMRGGTMEIRPISKHRVLTDLLRKRIADGEYACGEKFPTEMELEREFGVSNSTIREAVSCLVNEGIVQRFQGRGTFVSAVPREKTIAIYSDATAISSSSGHFWRALVDDANVLLNDAGYQAKLAVGYGDTVEERMASTHLLNSGRQDLAGVMVIGTDYHLARLLSDANVPSVSIDSWLNTEHCVFLDNARVAESAVQLFSEHGYSDYAFMYPESGLSQHYAAMEQTRKGMAFFGPVVTDLPEDRLVAVPDTTDRRAFCPAFKEWWSRKDRPDAMFFSDDSLFEAVSRAILELGISVPEDLAIITHANVGRYLEFPVPLTRIGFKASEAVDAAWRMLSALISEGDVQDPAVRLEPHVRIGKSLGMPRELSAASDSSLRVG
jgi:DNA-binding LacI/PurR family transcriptional regulator